MRKIMKTFPYLFLTIILFYHLHASNCCVNHLLITNSVNYGSGETDENVSSWFTFSEKVKLAFPNYEFKYMFITGNYEGERVYVISPHILSYADLQSDGTIQSWTNFTLSNVNSTYALSFYATGSSPGERIYIGTINDFAYADIQQDKTLGSWTKIDSGISILENFTVDTIYATGNTPSDRVYRTSNGGGFGYADIQGDGSLGSWTHIYSGNSNLPNDHIQCLRATGNNIDDKVYVGTYETLAYTKIQPDGSLGTWETIDSSTPNFPNGTIQDVYFTGNTSSDRVYVISSKGITYSDIQEDDSFGAWTLIDSTTSNLPIDWVQNIYVTGNTENCRAYIKLHNYGIAYATIQSDGSLGTWTIYQTE